MSDIIAPVKKANLSKAQKNHNYLEKLKATGKYEEYKKRKADKQRERRQRGKIRDEKLPLEQRKQRLVDRRRAGRERTQKYRANKKNKIVDLNGAKEAFKTKSALKKAVTKAKKALPRSPSKKTAVLINLFNNMEDQSQLLKNLKPSQVPVISNKNLELITDIQQFFERDDVSVTSPKVKDVKKYLSRSGEQILLPTRHMTLTLKEAYGLFDQERNNIGKDLCGLTFFKENRPPNIKIIGDLPKHLCLCIYHANFKEAVSALHKYVPTVPDYDQGFVNKFLCIEPEVNCWFAKCSNCSGITVPALKNVLEVDSSYLNRDAKWMVWKKNSNTNRTEKHEENGNLVNLIAHLTSIAPHFLRHSYIKRSQSNTFITFDRPRAASTAFQSEAVLQIDFAENFVCEMQDEVQSAHWNQRQLTLFTSALYHNEHFRSKVMISDNLSHTKLTIVPYLFKLLTDLPKSLTILKIWSDGPSSQFKNKFIAAVIPVLQERFHIKIIWNYFATSHGKGCIDGIGATVKTIVRKHIRARDCIVNNSSQFVQAFNRTVSQIIVEEVTDNDFETINNDLKTADIYARAKTVREISNAHQIQIIDENIIMYDTSLEGYN